MTVLAALLHGAYRLSGLILAQAPPPRPANVTSAKSYTMEWIVVAVCFAAALYAVCRPSRRS